MSRTIRGRAWVNGRIQNGVAITIDAGRISDVSIDPEARDGGDPLIIPGLVDCHVHGGAGADFMDSTVEAADTIARFHARNGTAALAATTLSGDHEAVLRAVQSIASASKRNVKGAAEIAAVHFEGPYINRRFSGAQSAAAIRPADPVEASTWFEACGALPILMTVAPEVEGVSELLTRFGSRVTFSIGHSGASYAETLDAVARGASHFTHLFNAMTPLHHREPGVVGAAMMSPEATVELIADGIHIHPAVLRLSSQLLAGRAILITDAMRACGMPDGRYTLHDHEVEVKGAEARLSDGTLAGSVLTMFGALRNMVELAGIPLELALPMATFIPARRLGLAHRKGSIDVGFDADLIVVNHKFEMQDLWISGEQVTS